ncbi:MAG: ribonuclease HI family protein [Phycisphaerae bacterium]
MCLTIHIDGGSRGNPGPAGAGVVIQGPDGTPRLEAGYFLGPMTNNQAEYTALIRALEAAQAMEGRNLKLISDSQLMVRQINGQYKVKNPGLRPLFQTAMARLSEFKRWNIRHVMREANQRADELANVAMDAREDVIEIGSDGPPTPTPGSRDSAPPTATIETPVVVAVCVRSPDADACPVPCPRKSEFFFRQTLPAGVCIGVAGNLLAAVDTAASDGNTVNVRCPREGCGATFEVRLA